MEVEEFGDTDAVDLGVDFNEFEDEFKDKKKDGACKQHEQEMDVDNLDDILADRENIQDTAHAEVSEGARPSSELGLEENISEKSNKSRKAKGSKEKRRRNHKDSFSKGKLFKTLHASPDLDPGILGREVAYRLGEKKVGLIVNVVKVLGFKATMKILEETKIIEKRGGIPTADKKRRRTSGGVFIFCLKEMDFATKEQINEIFKDEKVKLKEIVKRKRKEKTAKQREEISKLAEYKQQALKRVDQMMAKNCEKIEAGEIIEDGEA
eukprot:gene16781-18476_t